MMEHSLQQMKASLMAGCRTVSSSYALYFVLFEITKKDRYFSPSQLIYGQCQTCYFRLDSSNPDGFDPANLIENKKKNKV